MQLAREVLDKEIVDRDGFKAGKVDDLLLEVRAGDAQQCGRSPFRETLPGTRSGAHQSCARDRTRGKQVVYRLTDAIAQPKVVGADDDSRRRRL